MVAIGTVRCVNGCWSLLGEREGFGEDEARRRLSLVGGCERSSHGARSLVAGGRPWWGWKILVQRGCLLSVCPAEPSLCPSTRTARPSKPEKQIQHHRALTCGRKTRSDCAMFWRCRRRGLGFVQCRPLTASPALASFPHSSHVYYCPGPGCNQQIELQHGCERLD